MAPLASPLASPSTHTINSKSKETNVDVLQKVSQKSSDFLLLFEWLSIRQKDKTWGTALSDRVGGANVILYEPDKIMTELQWEVFVVTPFRQVILCPWVATVIVQWLHMNNSCNIQCRLNYSPQPLSGSASEFQNKRLCCPSHISFNNHIGPVNSALRRSSCLLLSLSGQAAWHFREHHILVKQESHE